MARLWMASLVVCSACTAPPDIVAVYAGATAAGEAAGGAAGASAADAGAGGGAGESGAAATSVPLTGALAGRDPSALFDAGALWIVVGGAAVTLRTSRDLVDVEDTGQILRELPAWVATEVPDAQTFWSPELAYFEGLYHLYYAVSTLGSSRSCIGHATAEVLDVASTWTDRGPVLCSKTTDNFNAIDPSVLLTSDGGIWLAFGSYLSGIKLAPLDTTGTQFLTEPVAIAARPDSGGALQASALAERDGYYYLFTAFGADVAHRLMMGRASSIGGPYVDQAGTPLLEGGGTPLLEANARFVGPGSNDVFLIGEQYYNIYHAYDEDNARRATLRLATLEWSADGWPVSGGP